MFISLATKQTTDERRKRVEKIKELLALHEQKKIEIAISTMAIVEFRPYQDAASHDPANVKRIEELFNSTDITLYDLTPGIAAMAREIGEKNHALTPTDSIHIATAIFAKADVLFTFDGVGKRRRQKDMIANTEKFGNPPLKISEPYVDLGPLIDEQTP